MEEKLAEFKLESNSTETIATDILQSEEEKRLKNDIEKLFREIHDLCTSLKNDETEIKEFCVFHFAKLKNNIFLQKEEIKIKLDEIVENLISDVNHCKSKHQDQMKWVLSTKTVEDIKEIEDMENYFREETKSAIFPKKAFEDLKKDLSNKVGLLNEKLTNILVLRNKIGSCSVNLDKINEAKETFFDQLKLSNLRNLKI